MFLSLADRLGAAAESIQETIQEGLGPISLLSDTEQLKANALNFAIDFGIQIAATVILFIIIRFFFWKPITKILEERRNKIDKDLKDAEVAKANAIEIESNLQRELDEAKAKIKEMLDTAEKEANIRRDTIINQAKEEAKRRLENVEQELIEEKKSMEKEIRQEIVNIAFQAAEKIVQKEINQDKYLDVVDDILKGAIAE
ncbi:MAG: F0F1 ATP synthase subunit B [Acholeplasmatales bacterium]|nr:F0F1 ATP synthase subunit B [Acholeplasmatales bacterium]